jgi:hypothetical protein
MQELILNRFKQSNATLNRDRSRDLFSINNRDAFKQAIHFLIINIIIILIAVSLNKDSSRCSSSV